MPISIAVVDHFLLRGVEVDDVRDICEPALPCQKPASVPFGEPLEPVRRPHPIRVVRPCFGRHLVMGFLRNPVRRVESLHRDGGVEHEVPLVLHSAVLYRRRDEHIAEGMCDEPLRPLHALHRV